MQFKTLTAALLAIFPAAGVLAGQIPVVDGVIGGLRSAKNATTQFELQDLHTDATIVPGALRVTENSGICETTPGVYQASGYGDLTAKESIFFWFFEARENAATAPLTLWFNGGPGSSSMIGLFQEHGPCRITNDSSSVTYNPYSWNNASNMIYIDQPVGVGFSYGTESVGTSQEAASDVWTFMQIFLKDSRFSKYATAPLQIWTESYGGHYGPTFAQYFLTQNAAIKAGSATGVNLNLKTLAIGNGLTDPITQYPGYITYAGSNPYHPLVSTSTITSANRTYTKSGGCAAQITSCNNKGSNSVCSAAQEYCNDNILSPLAGNYDVYYVPSKNPDSYPPDITDYLASIKTKAGAASTWQETNDDVYNNFADTGDWMRTSKPDLESVINSGVRVLIFDGDADYILNFNGVESMVNSLVTNFSTAYGRTSFATWTVNGQSAGQYRQAGTFSYLRIYGAGHEVAAYKYGTLAYGQAAYQFFSQISANNGLSST